MQKKKKVIKWQDHKLDSFENFLEVKKKPTEVGRKCPERQLSYL